MTRNHSNTVKGRENASIAKFYQSKKRMKNRNAQVGRAGTFKKHVVAPIEIQGSEKHQDAKTKNSKFPPKQRYKEENILT